MPSYLINEIPGIPEDVKADIARRNVLDYKMIEWVKSHKNGINL